MRVPAAVRPADRHAVGPLELFFDLVYVFAISQLSHHLLEHLSWRGAAETFVLLVPVYLTWLQTTWATGWFDVVHRPVQTVVIVLMLLGLFANASLGGAFEDTPWTFVVAFAALNVGRDLWLLATEVSDHIKEHHVRMLVWTVPAAVLWVLGAAAEPHDRLRWWAVAAGVELVGQVVAHPVPGRRLDSANRPVAVAYLLERARLFFMIAIGEVVVLTAMAMSSHLADGWTILTGTVAFATAVAIWRCYFDAREGETRAALIAADDPMRHTIHKFNVLFVVVGALILVAVGEEVVIGHPTDGADVTLALLLYGGGAAYLGAHAWFAWRLNHHRLTSRLAGVGALAVLGVVSLALPAWAAAVGALLPLVAVAVADHRELDAGVVPATA